MADMIRADLRASYAISENSSSVGTAHWAITTALRARAMPLGFETRHDHEAPGTVKMRNLYLFTKNQAAIRDLFKVAYDTTGR